MSLFTSKKFRLMSTQEDRFMIKASTELIEITKVTSLLMILLGLSSKELNFAFIYFSAKGGRPYHKTQVNYTIKYFSSQR